MRPLKQFCKSALLLTVCMTAPLSLISRAFADNTALVSFDTSQYLSHSNYDDAGYIFTNSNPLLITSIGLYTQSASLAQSHQLSLYTTSGTLLFWLAAARSPWGRISRLMISFSTTIPAPDSIRILRQGNPRLAVARTPLNSSVQILYTRWRLPKLPSPAASPCSSPVASPAPRS